MTIRSPIMLSDHAVEQLAAAIQTVRIESTSLDWPAWVQAVGSVVAIVAAVWIARLEAQRERAAAAEGTQRERAASARDAAELVETIAHHWEEAMSDLSYIAQNTGDIVDNVGNLTVVEQVLREDLDKLRTRICPRITKLSDLPLTAWPDVGMGLDFYAFQANLVRVTRTLERTATVDATSYPEPFRTLAVGFVTELRDMYEEAERTLGVYQAEVGAYREVSATLGYETRLAKREREAKETSDREQKLAIKAEAARRASARAEIIASFPPEGERTDAETSVLEMSLSMRRLEPLQPFTKEEQDAEDQAEADHLAEMARRDEADRARIEARDQRDREYERNYGDDATER